MEMAGATADLVFLHISDIHFRQAQAGDVHDANQGIRNELQRDLRRLRAKLPRLDGLILTGDIAFAGKPDEYAFAANWIESIRESVGCAPEGVMVTPGNHDVDRDLIPDAGTVHAIHQQIRAAATLAEHDERLAAVLRDAVRGESLLTPLAAYNDFARKYGCEVTRTQPYWERRFPLSDGTQIRIRGLTTTLLSGPHDHEQTSKMLYGAAQRMILRQDGVRNIVVGHHPPSWSIEGEVAERDFSTLTVLQAYGHKHDQWLVPIGNCLRIVAGALQPDLREPQWLPRYSAIEVSAQDNRHLRVVVYPRRWSFEELMFIPDFNSQASDRRVYVLEVEPAAE
jgi:hypothetical protein